MLLGTVQALLFPARCDMVSSAAFFFATGRRHSLSRERSFFGNFKQSSLFWQLLFFLHFQAAQLVVGADLFAESSGTSWFGSSSFGT